MVSHKCRNVYRFCTSRNGFSHCFSNNKMIDLEGEQTIKYLAILMLVLIGLLAMALTSKEVALW